MPEGRMSRYLPCLMFGEHAGDVIVHDHDLIEQPEPLLRENADGRRAAADAHPGLALAVDDGRRPRLNHQLRAAIDRKIYRLFITQRSHELARCAALLLATAREVMNTADREHLRAVLRRRDVTDEFAVEADVGLFRPKKPVGIDLQFEAAIAEDALGHDGDDVHLRMATRHDERRRLVIRIGGSRAHAGQEQRRRLIRHRMSGQDHGIDAGEESVDISPTITGTRASLADVAQNRAGVAANLIWYRSRRHSALQYRGSRRQRQCRIHVFCDMVDSRVPSRMFIHVGAVS
jgi:hypothetical protein